MKEGLASKLGPDRLNFAASCYKLVRANCQLDGKIMIGSITWYSVLLPYRLVALDSVEDESGYINFTGTLKHTVSGELVTFSASTVANAAAHSLETLSMAALKAAREHKERLDAAPTDQ